MTSPPAWVQHVLTPHQADSSDLRWAIETAAAMWARGEQLQALRWLAHGIETARGEGRAERAMELDRAAAELERVAQPQPEVEMYAPARAVAPVAAQVASAPPSAAESASMKTTAPYRIAPDDITCLVAPDAKLLQQCEPEGFAALDTDPQTEPPSPPKPKADRPRPPPSSIDYEPTMTAAGTTRSKPAKTLVMHSGDPALAEALADADQTLEQPPSRHVFGSESTRPYGFVPSSAAIDAIETRDSEPRVDSEEPSQQSSLPTTLESPQSPLEAMRAVRVAIEGGVGSRFTIVLLADHEAAPDGMQEALLVPLVSKPDAES